MIVTHFLCASVFMLLLGTLQTEAGQSTCSCLNSQSETVYLGWPYAIKCADLYWEMEPQYFETPKSDPENQTDFEQHEPENDATCMIFDMDKQKLIFNATVPFQEDFQLVSYHISDFSRSTSLNYLVRSWLFGNATKCYEFTLKLSVVEFQQTTCQEALTLLPSTEREMSAKGQIFFTCDDPDMEMPFIHTDVFPSDYTMTWYYNCKELPRGSVQTGSLQYTYANPELVVSKVSSENNGTYTCAIAHNGMKRYAASYNLRVTGEIFQFKPTITCKAEKYASLQGESVTMICVGSIENPNNLIKYRVKWQKKDSDKDYIFQCNSRVRLPSNSARHFCSLHLENGNVEIGQISSEYHLIMKYKIKKVVESDFGSYVVTLKTYNYETSETVILAEDVPAKLTRKSFVFGILIALASILLIAMGILWWNRIYVQVVWKRNFGLCTEDDKKFGAFITYYFSRDLDKFSQQQAQDAVATVRETLTALGYSVCDEYKDGSEPGGKADALLDCMKQCHRVVIILSTSFLKDQWNLYTLQQSFEEMIKSKSKLIFILVPGMREYLRQHSSGDDTVRMVQRAAKMNCAIEWSDTSKFDQKYFSHLLELEMPKLKSERSSRLGSLSSTVSSQVQYKNGIRRTLSNDTYSTDLESQDSTVGIIKGEKLG